MNKIEKLKDELNRLAGLNREINIQIKAIVNEKKLPSLKEKYEGKYFKFDNLMNSYSSCIYSFCQEVISAETVNTTTFEIRNINELEILKFYKKKNAYVFLFQTEITKAEFESNFELFKTKITL